MTKDGMIYGARAGTRWSCTPLPRPCLHLPNNIEISFQFGASRMQKIMFKVSPRPFLPVIKGVLFFRNLCYLASSAHIKAVQVHSRYFQKGQKKTSRRVSVQGNVPDKFTNWNGINAIPFPHKNAKKCLCPVRVDGAVRAGGRRGAPLESQTLLMPGIVFFFMVRFFVCFFQSQRCSSCWHF